MINVSKELRALLDSSNAPAPKIKIKTGNRIFGYDDETNSNIPVEQDNILSLNLHYAGASDDYPLGTAYSNYIDVELWDIGTNVILTGKEMYVFVGYEVNGSVEWINAGTFFPEKPSRSGQVTSFTAYDRMKTLTNAYVPAFLFESSSITISEGLIKVSEHLGFDLHELPSDLMNQKVDISLFTSMSSSDDDDETVIKGVSANAFIANLAGAAGYNALFNRNDELQLYRFTKAYNSVGNQYEITDDSTDAPSVGESDHIIQYVSCNNDNTEIVSPQEGSFETGISINNPLISTQAHLDSIFIAISEAGEPFAYRVASFKHLTGDITLECFDIVKYTDLNGNSYQLPLMSLTFAYDGGLVCNIASFGKTKAEMQNESSTLDKMTAEINSANQAVSATKSKIDAAMAEMRSNYTEAIQSAQSIMFKAIEECVKTEDFETLKKTVSAQFELTASSINFSFNTLQETIIEENEAINQQLTNITKHIRFEDGEMIIGDSQNTSETVVKNGKFSIMTNGEDQTYLTGKDCHATNVEAEEKLCIGNFAFIKRSNGNLSLKKIR